MTNKEILKTALIQSAIDLSCDPNDFLSEHNLVVISHKNDHARKYIELPFKCNLVSYGNNIVASTCEDMKELVKQYINSYPIEHCFETPNLHALNDRLQERGLRICFMAEYFLPDMEFIKPLPCQYKIKLLDSGRFAELYKPEWSNALCEKRKHLDMLCAAAYDGDNLIGLAGASADCDSMWQIGIDVLPEYRRQGIACALTSRMAIEILNRGKVPFYCAAWSNIKSVRNAIKSGFRPAWVELTVKSQDFVNKMNFRGNSTS